MIVVARQWEWLGYVVGGAVGRTVSHIKHNGPVVGCKKRSGRKEIPYFSIDNTRVIYTKKV